MRLAQWMLLVSSTVLAATNRQEEDGHVLEDPAVENASDLYEDEYLQASAVPERAVTPRCCTDEDPTNLLIVSTMDGKVQALDIDNGGSLVWASDLDGSPLLGGNLGRQQIVNPLGSPGESFYLVPSLDGSLYMFSDEQRLLEPIPLSTELLLKSVKIGNEAVAGGKTFTTTGVDPVTGKIRYHCTSALCEQANIEERPYSTLVFRRVSHAVRAVDALSGNEKWNLSVAEYDASLVRRGSPPGAPQAPRKDTRFVISPPKGTITAIDGCGKALWSTSLNIHIARSWHLSAHQLQEVSIFDSNVHSTDVSPMNVSPSALKKPESLFYLGTINEDPFILCSAKVRKEMQRLSHNMDYIDMISTRGDSPGAIVPFAGVGYQVEEGGTLDSILNRAFKRTFNRNSGPDRKRRQIAYGREEELRVALPAPGGGSLDPGTCSDEDPNGLMVIGNEDIVIAEPYDGEGDLGWFVMRPHQAQPLSRKDSLSIFTGRGTCNADFFKKSLHLENDVNPLWRLLAIFLMIITSAIGMFKLLRWRRASDAVSSAWSSTDSSPYPSEPPSPDANPLSVSAPLLASPKEELPSPKRETVSDEPLATANAKETAKRSRNISSMSSGNSTSESFQSKFLADFEPVKVLGRGGFGVVFEAQNKLDECNYAVKRIAVSNNEKAIERVLREVRAMAKLDHAGIIRYYHTWIERPPEGWQKDIDRELLNKMNAGKNIKAILKLSSEESSSSSISATDNSISLAAPPIAAEDDTEEQSWLDDAASGPRLPESSSDESTSSEDSSSSESALDEVIPMKTEDGSHSVVFGNSFGSRGSAKSRASQYSEISKLEADMVIVTSIDEELLPSKNTSNFVYLYIQMQLCQKKTLYAWLIANQTIESRKMKGWMRQMVSAVQYIHQQGLIHRDIKPQNIFFSCEDQLKVGDLGLVTKGGEDQMGADARDRRSSSSISLHTDNVGTRTYMSPEQLANQAYTSKVDVFSLGLIFTELVIPFGTLMERSKVLKRLQSGEQPEQIQDRSDVAQFVAWLTSMDPDQRPSCDRIIACDFLQND